MVALATLALGFALLVVLTWKKWGNPALDAGAELTTAERVADGAVPYRDVRYFYGPLGLYGLAGSFELLGTSLATAFAFGLAISAAIIGAFYALARQWLQPATAAVCAAMTMAIGFSGTAFNFVLPHSNSATVGLLCLLLALLALCRRRPLLAGLAIGAAGLTRPEFFAVAALAAAVWLVASSRQRPWRAVLADGLRIGLPALAIPLAVLGAFAASAGAHRLLWENLWPVDFIRVAGFRSQEDWAPLTLASGASTAGRALVYCSLLGALAWAALIWQRRSGAARLAALLPPLGAVLALALLDASARALGFFEAARVTIEHETFDLTLGMTWLPALAIGAAAVTVVAMRRRGGPPLGRSWPDDAALVAVALVLGLRAYDAFNGEALLCPLLRGAPGPDCRDPAPADRRALAAGARRGHDRAGARRRGSGDLPPGRPLQRQQHRGADRARLLRRQRRLGAGAAARRSTWSMPAPSRASRSSPCPPTAVSTSWPTDLPPPTR